jgi:hypothetical protein
MKAKTWVPTDLAMIKESSNMEWCEASSVLQIHFATVFDQQSYCVNQSKLDGVKDRALREVGMKTPRDHMEDQKTIVLCHQHHPQHLGFRCLPRVSADRFSELKVDIDPSIPLSPGSPNQIVYTRVNPAKVPFSVVGGLCVTKLQPSASRD